MTNETEEKAPTISDDLVVTKYKMAADIVNRKFTFVTHEFTILPFDIELLMPGSSTMTWTQVPCSKLDLSFV